MHTHFFHRSAALFLAALSAAAHAQSDPAQLPKVVVEGHYDNAVGTSDAASEGTVTAKLIASRPTLRPAEVLEFVPGLIVSQHSGDGKANQYYLRGFNLDHGTDFATFVDGMPVNMPSHAHGQGYSDLNWLMPELVNTIRYKKGPYFAEEGDFASAGAAHIGLIDDLPKGIAELTLGQRGYRRAFLADTATLTTGHLLYALEAAHNDGPWVVPEKFHKVNGVLRYSVGNADDRQTLTAMAYAAGWDSTDQIPVRAVDAGLVGRYGALDPTDGGQTARYSLSYNLTHSNAAGELKVNAYAIQSRLNLYSDFSFYADAPEGVPAEGPPTDQFEQQEHRRVFGADASQSFNGTLVGHEATNTVGVQLRHDRLDPVGLYSTVARVRQSTIQESRVRETSVALYADNATQWLPWFRTVAGARIDHFNFDVASSIAANSGHADANIASPKLSLIFGPWSKTEFFANYGWGYHSNDARGTTEHVAPREGTPSDPVTPLVRSKGGELGLRSNLLPGLQTSVALWRLDLGSELVFSGDAGDTQPSGASERYGLELNNHYIATPWLLFDADVAMSHARFKEAVPASDGSAGDHIPGSINRVASVGATVTDRGPWFGHVQLRYFGPRPLIEDGSQNSRSTTLAYLRVGYKISPDWKLALDVFNLFDRRASDIDYYDVSRLKGETTTQDNLQFHPVEPRSLRMTLTANF